MDYATLKARVRGLINRNDMTDELAAQFVQMAQDRLDRWPQVDPLRYAPRPSFQENYVKLTIPADEFEPGAFTVPTNFLSVLSIHCDTVEAERVGVPEFIKYPTSGIGIPCVFMQTGHTIHLRPVPSPTTEVHLFYYGTVAPLVEDTDENDWSASCSSALLYGAAAYAADYFEDERFQHFENRFKEALLEIQDQTANEFQSGSMAMSTPYTFPNED